MHDFLRSIADGYIQHDGPEVVSNVFVFPNSRSGKYFSDYVFNQIDRRPLCITMTELMEKCSGLKTTSRNELVFRLYAAYVKVFRRANPKSEPEDFDRFHYWAELLLKDFDEIDRYMVDADMLLRNVENYKELQSTYLTEEQIRIIRDFWGIELQAPAAADGDIPFWSHIGSHGKPMVGKFKQIWALLGDIYKEFRGGLLADGLRYPGLAYRRAVEQVRETHRLPFSQRRFVFIGFHRLSTSEHLLLEELKRMGEAHFYWEYDPALMNPSTGNKAGRFIANYQRTFTDALDAVSLPSGGKRHAVKVVRVPSNVGQVKVAAQLLRQTDTAVVLPDEGLLLPMVASVPEEFEQINVTMGYPLRYSQISQLYASLEALQLRAHVGSTGQTEYFRGDVMRLLSLPMIQSVAPEEEKALRQFMKQHSLYNLPAMAVNLVPDLDVLRPLLTLVADPNDIDEVTSYTLGMLAVMKASGMVEGIEAAAIDGLSTQVEEIRSLVKKHGIGMSQSTFFRMLERSVFTRTLPVKSVSFDAMQIMGLLETRCLGFNNVMMLSMTDDVMPGRTFTRSFIPEALRRAYGLPTMDHYDTDSAYIFYRILSNAENLTLILDSRCGGNRSGDVSRYISQLQRLNFPGVDVEIIQAEIGPEVASGQAGEPLLRPDMVVEKDERVQKLLERYRDPAQIGKYRLSASVLKTYMTCPMHFYLERVENVRPAEPERENMDALTTGNIIHEVAEQIYAPFVGKTVTQADIDSLLDEKKNPTLRTELRRAINANFMHMPRTVEDPATGREMPNPALLSTELNGEASMYEESLMDMLREMLLNEPVPFTYLHGEVPQPLHWTLPNGEKFNFIMKIDRADQVNGVTRLVDYKTGRDATKYDPETLMEGANPAVFQVFTYAEAYMQLNPTLTPDKIQPIIYQVKKGEYSALTRSGDRKGPVLTYQDEHAQFMEDFSALIAEIFDPKVPFVRNQDEKECEYCPFKNFCIV